MPADRGVVGLGIYGGKFEENWGTVVRSARAFGADYAFTIAGRYRDGSVASVGHDQHFPVFQFDTVDEFRRAIPTGTQIVRLDVEATTPLHRFTHPEKVAYVLGAEDYGFDEAFRATTTGVRIETEFCLNVATAGTVVLYDRQAKAAESSYGKMLKVLAP